MAHDGPKQHAFEQFAQVARALGSAHRLELIDTLVQGERSVERLAHACGLSVTNASQHLHQLKRAGLVASRKTGTRVIYSVSDPDVLELVRTLWRVAENNVPDVDYLRRKYYLNRDKLEPVSRETLLARMKRDSNLTVLDVRPAEEWAAGHVPGAINIPVNEIDTRLGEIPKERQTVTCCRGPYCVYSYQAVEALRPHGFDIRRLEGGFSEWLARGLPIERAAGPANVR